MASSRAQAAAVSVASSLGLRVDDAIVLQASNKLSVRLLPCDVLARVAGEGDRVARFEIGLAQRLAEAGCPVGTLDPRVEPLAYEHDGFEVTLWTYYEPASASDVSPADYADALGRLHVGMREVDYPTPHFTDRVEEALQLLADRDRTPELADPDREFLADTLRGAASATGADQLLHGEPHPGNLLSTRDGLVFIDLETCCRGPVEFDVAHAPEEVAKHYPGLDEDLLRRCRALMLAMITTWRWDRDDRLPDGRRLGLEWMAQLRAGQNENVS